MKTIFFDGLRFTRHDNGKYYRNAKTRKRLHRYVYEYHNGEIPDGYEVHHIDGDTDNNDISNLALVTKEEHKRIHAEMLTEERREWRRNNLNTKARPKAVEWHKSKQGSKWHSEHIKRQRKNGAFTKDLECVYCGIEFTGDVRSKFCSNKCKSAYRRKIGVDDVERVCVVCGKTFKSNKYSKTQTCGGSCHAKLVWEHRYESKSSKKDRRKTKGV